jgi:hypothetical protein
VKKKSRPTTNRIRLTITLKSKEATREQLQNAAGYLDHLIGDHVLAMCDGEVEYDYDSSMVELAPPKAPKRQPKELPLDRLMMAR